MRTGMVRVFGVMVVLASAACGTGASSDAESSSRSFIVPEGATVSVRLTTGVDSKSARVGQPVAGTLTTPLEVDGVIVAPAGSHVEGVVTAAEASGKVKGRASLALAFRTLDVEGQRRSFTIDARTSLVADATKGEDAANIAVPAVGGAVIGGLVGGKKGAVIGGVVGGGAGTAVVLSTSGDEVVLPAGTVLRLTLQRPAEIILLG